MLRSRMTLAKAEVRMNQRRIIAVDTSLETNFLISSTDDATVSELRGLIQSEHLSCFPEHGSIKVKSLMVEFNKKEYHLTDSLCIGQIFRKKWNRVHAEVCMLAFSTFRDSKSVEGERHADIKTGNPGGGLKNTCLVNSISCNEGENLANVKTGNPDGVLNNTSLVKSIGCNDLGVDSRSNEALINYSGPHFHRKDFENNKDVITGMSDDKECRIDDEKFRCLFLMEAPCTQPFSQQNLSRTAANIKALLNNSSDCKRQKYDNKELDPIQDEVKMMTESIDDCDGNEVLSPHKNCTLTDRTRIEELNGMETQKSTQADKYSQGVGGAATTEGNICENQYKNSSSTEASKENSGTVKLVSADCKREYAVVNEPIIQISDKEKIHTESSSPKLSAEMNVKGPGDAMPHKGSATGKMGYRIQLNEHSVLLIASLSADMVPETQESQLQSQDSADDEMCYSPSMKPTDACHKQDPVEHEALIRKQSPLCQERMDINDRNIEINVENVTIVAEKLTSYGGKHQTSGSANNRSSQERSNAANETQIVGAHPGNPGKLSHDFGIQAINHEVSSLRKKEKKQRKRKHHKTSAEKNVGATHSCDSHPHTDGDMKLEQGGNMKLTEKKTERYSGERGENDILQKQVHCELKDLGEENAEIRREIRIEAKSGKDNHKDSSSSLGEKDVALDKASVDVKDDKEKCTHEFLEGACAVVQEHPQSKQQIVAESDSSLKKRKRHRNECSHFGTKHVLGIHPPSIRNKKECVPFAIKDLPKTYGSTFTKEIRLDDKQVLSKKSKHRKKDRTKLNVDTDPLENHCSEDMTTRLTMMNGRADLLEGGYVESSSINNNSKQSCEEHIHRWKPGFDVYEFDSSDTVSRQEEDLVNHEVASNPNEKKLELPCSDVGGLVKDNNLRPLNTPPRRSSRKPVHPKRWNTTVLSEKLTSNQMSKSNSKGKHGGDEINPNQNGTPWLPSNELNIQILSVQEEAVQEESSQIVLDEKRIACPGGCGRQYAKKTSAYYRHSKKCVQEET
ncbi:hypothetical protein KP509_03G097900 [Ceratopteris richardii]|uniref:Uncharacterized protein n=1 Tax=Ceratopteris richardii TaxID=49495 RepID=A0A8T2V6H2_CERRI|nr:hypothetical protein KP509_03G097900 [Ceratopteris richardii]